MSAIQYNDGEHESDWQKIEADHELQWELVEFVEFPVVQIDNCLIYVYSAVVEKFCINMTLYIKGKKKGQTILKRRGKGRGNLM